MKSISITLGEHQFAVPKLNIGQIERVGDMFADLPGGKVPYAVLKLALERADPPKKPDEVEALECRLDEIGKAVDAILVFSGFKEAAGPNAAAPEAPGTAS
jgi:hypothetical protein